MAVETTHRKIPAGRELTLGELREFVADCERLGVDKATVIDGRASLRGLTQLSVKTGVFARPRRDRPCGDIAPAAT